MKNTWYIMTFALVALLLTSCKTTEENYRAAYEIAAERKANTSVDRNMSGFIEREKRLGQIQVVAGDSVRVVTERVNIVDGETANLHKYCVVVGDFKQVFNARSFSKRINEAEGSAYSYVIKNSQDVYYVVYRGFDSKDAAAEFLKNKKNFKILVANKEPWIVEVP